MFYSFFRRGKAKFLLSPFFPVHPRKSLLRGLIWLIDHTIGKIVVQRAACCFAETKQEVEWLKGLGARKVVLLPNSLPEEAFVKGSARAFRRRWKVRGKMIFSLGRHVPIKNFEELIGVLRRVDATLVIGGRETEYTKKCKELAEKLGVTDKVVWTGFLDSRGKRDAFSACDVFICSSFRESLGNVVIEAMAQGRPVIGTNNGGLPEVVPHEFCLYESGNGDELVQKIQKIFEDKGFSGVLGKMGREKAREYEFKKMKKKYLETLKEL